MERLLRLELEQADHGNVKVTTVTPSYISTGMFAGARGPVLAPILEPGYVVDRVWRAMLAGRPLVQLPWSVGFSRALRGLLPTRAFDRIVGDGFGVYRTMERFTGRSCGSRQSPRSPSQSRSAGRNRSGRSTLGRCAASRNGLLSRRGGARRRCSYCASTSLRS